MGSLTFRAARALVAGTVAAARWLVFLIVVVAIGLPLVRIAANWYVRGTIEIAPPEQYRPASDMRLLAVDGASPQEVAAVRSAAASLRYRFDARAISVVVVESDPRTSGAQGEFLPYLDIIRVRRSVVRAGGVLLQWTLAHEIGHYVDQRFMSERTRERYMSLRHIPPSLGWQSPAAPWNERPDEDFAEVFAALAVPSAVAPPATSYGRIEDPAAIVSLLRDAGVVFGRSPPPTGWRDILAREFQLLWTTLTEPLLLRPLLVLLALYLAMGALPAMLHAWRDSAEDEGVPHEERVDSRMARVLNTPRLVSHTSRSRHAAYKSRHHGGRG